MAKVSGGGIRSARYRIVRLLEEVDVRLSAAVSARPAAVSVRLAEEVLVPPPPMRPGCAGIFVPSLLLLPRARATPQSVARVVVMRLQTHTPLGTQVIAKFDACPV